LKKLAKRLWPLLASGLLAASACTHGAGPGGGSATNQAMDQDKNGIFDTLDQRLSGLSDTALLPVLVMENRPTEIAEMEKAAGPMEVKYQYSVVPALAASLTRQQVEILARQDYIHHIEYDGEVHMTLDGATRWFGATQARQDFAVDGNHDGSPSYSQNDVVVAVIDTGVDAAHVDLAGGKVIAFKDWVNNRTAPYDDNGHGTHVSGIVAGTGTGNPAYTGVAPGAALIGLKVLDGNGSGSLSNVAAAVDWAVANKDQYNIRVISMSLG
jgi:serine protease AprX